jgi:hypothetical protein
MNEYIVNGWQDYWKIFNHLIEKLKANHQDQIIMEFEDAQNHVNGLTDGWFEFKFAFEKSLQVHRSKMSYDQIDMADFLIMTLNKTLTNR